MVCPECKEEGIEIDNDDWLDFSEVPAYCHRCDKIVWISIIEDHGGLILDKNVIPPYRISQKIRVINDRSSLFNKIGRVIDKDHIHYRIKINNFILWVPEHWIEKV